MQEMAHGTVQNMDAAVPAAATLQIPLTSD
jgi:hypothetical protein